jgi:surface antigen
MNAASPCVSPYQRPEEATTLLRTYQLPPDRSQENPMRKGNWTMMAALVAAWLLALPQPGFCDKGGGHGGRGNDDERREERHQEKKRGGKHQDRGHGREVWVEWRGRRAPPPWAPAHGYRGQYYRERRGGREVIIYREVEVRTQAVPVYAAPYGIDAGRCNRQQVGQILGGAVGGILGSQVGKGSGRTAAIIGGAVIGLLVGGEIGRGMDQIDQACVGQVLEHAPTGEHVEWVDPDRKANYSVTPTDTYQDTQGRYCREYQTTASIGGKTRQLYGTACRQPDGSWEIVK